MNKVPFNKTKIVATIGPASSSHEVLRKMMIAGVDVCRLNLSHGEDSVHEGVINTIRDLNKELNLHTSILVDLQGPKLRIGFIDVNRITGRAERVVMSHDPESFYLPRSGRWWLAL